MKRLLILTTLALIVTSSTGCFRPWGWRRGAPCDPCAAGPYEMGYNGGGYEMAYPPAVSGTPNLLPGPVQVLPPG
jgi:hypothetical protein